MDYISDLKICTPFIWIYSCKNVRKLDNNLNDSGFCIVAGKLGSDELISVSLKEDMHFTVEELKWMIRSETEINLFEKRKDRLHQGLKYAQKK